MTDKPKVTRGVSVDTMQLNDCSVTLTRDGEKSHVNIVIDRYDPEPGTLAFTLWNDDARNLGESLLGIAPPDTRKKIKAKDVSGVDYGGDR